MRFIQKFSFVNTRIALVNWSGRYYDILWSNAHDNIVHRFQNVLTFAHSTNVFDYSHLKRWGSHHHMERQNEIWYEDVRKKPGCENWSTLLMTEDKWVGHVLRTEDSRIPRQATQCKLSPEPGYKRKPGRPRNYWMDIIRRDLKDMDTVWEEAEELAADRAGMRLSGCGLFSSLACIITISLRSR